MDCIKNTFLSKFKAIARNFFWLIICIYLVVARALAGLYNLQIKKNFYKLDKTKSAKSWIWDKNGF